MTDAMQQIEHIVVLMMENRSFDNMLGHLTLDGRDDIDGLRPELSNDHGGESFPVFQVTDTQLTKMQDPPHGPARIDEAVAGGAMSGFVDAFASEHPDDEEPDIVMGYHTALQLPVYEHLAERFMVCDRWFSSVPGSTWPNRLYAVAGRAAGSRSNRNPPIYDVPTFFRHLDDAGASWCWYAHDPGTLRALDGRYRLGPDKNFAFFNRRSLLERRHFLDDAREGTLPAVSWIDPNFVDLQGPLDRTSSNDDHPPSDVRNGQALVLEAYNAVARGPLWDTTLFIVAYDEHGGFYDHVPPPAAADDVPEFRRYGVRVPAFLVTPWVPERSVAPRDPVFDHTSIIKTILERFCRGRGDEIPSMTTRVDTAASLWPLLTETAARRAPLHEIDDLIGWAADRSRDAFVARRTTQFVPNDQPSLELNDLQQDVADIAGHVRAQGVPANKA
jgi:phospholipase C